MEHELSLRPGTTEDLNQVLVLNEAEANWTSYVNLSELATLVDYSTLFSVSVVNSAPVGFLIVMAHDSDYSGANYRWFKQRYSNFWYVDRIVVSRVNAGLGIGRRLYEYGFQQACQEGIEGVACEYSIEPMNEGSKLFHRRMGFHEVGIRQDDANDKVVSMQFRDLSGCAAQ